MTVIKENEQKILNFFREIWTRQNIEVVDTTLSPDFNFILPFAHIRDRESFKKLLHANHQIFEDLTYHVDDEAGDVVATESKGACCWRITGKHVDTWRGVPATNREVETRGISFFKFSPEGWITEVRVQNDLMGLLRQIDGVKVLSDF